MGTPATIVTITKRSRRASAHLFKLCKRRWAKPAALRLANHIIRAPRFCVGCAAAEPEGWRLRRHTSFLSDKYLVRAAIFLPPALGCRAHIACAVINPNLTSDIFIPRFHLLWSVVSNTFISVASQSPIDSCVRSFGGYSHFAAQPELRRRR